MAGYGKSALLEADQPDGGVVSSALALVSSGLPDGVSWIGVDDFDGIGADDQARLIRLLTDRQEVDITIASRSPVSAAVRCSLGGRVSERDAGDLALTPYEIARLLAAEAGVIDPEAALRVAELTAGWPMLVHFARDALSRDSHVDLAAALTAPGTPPSDWIRTSVLETLPPGTEDVLRVLAGIDASGPITQGLYDAIAGATSGGVPDLVGRLRRGGLLVARRRVGRVRELVLVPAVALLLAQESGGPPGHRVAANVARAYEADRAWLPAARTHAVAGDPPAAAANSSLKHSEGMLRRGDAGPSRGSSSWSSGSGSRTIGSYCSAPTRTHSGCPVSPGRHDGPSRRWWLGPMTRGSRDSLPGRRRPLHVRGVRVCARRTRSKRRPLGSRVDPARQ